MTHTSIKLVWECVVGVGLWVQRRHQTALFIPILTARNAFLAKKDATVVHCGSNCVYVVLRTVVDNNMLTAINQAPLAEQVPQE